MMPILIICGTVFIFLGIFLFAFIIWNRTFLKEMYGDEDRTTAILFTILFGLLLILSPESILAGVCFVLKGLGY